MGGCLDKRKFMIISTLKEVLASLRQLESVLNVPRSLLLKFGQNQVS